MTASTDSQVRCDPYDVELIADPRPVFGRPRDGVQHAAVTSMPMTRQRRKEV